MFVYFWESASGRGAEGAGAEDPKQICTDSSDPTWNHEPWGRAQAEVRRLTHWATQLPPVLLIIVL